ncbi:hypothetical protein FCV25MIE_22819 [Fagus crenata]
MNRRVTITINNTIHGFNPSKLSHFFPCSVTGFIVILKEFPSENTVKLSHADFERVKHFRNMRCENEMGSLLAVKTCQE